MKITIIIPTRNEGENISHLLDAIQNETRNIQNHNFSILIVDGQSTDNTIEKVKEIQSKNPNIYIITEKEKKGLGNAYLQGINYAIDELKTEAFMEFDGDFQHDPKDIRKLVEKMDQGYDYIIGSRYIPGGTIPADWPWYRKFISSAGNAVIKFFLYIKINDGTSGFKLTRINGFNGVNGFRDKLPLKPGQLFSLRHAYKIHFLYAMIYTHARTVEVPINFLNRNKGISKSTLEDIVESLKVVWLILWNYRILHRGFKNKN